MPYVHCKAPQRHCESPYRHELSQRVNYPQIGRKNFVEIAIFAQRLKGQTTKQTLPQKVGVASARPRL